MLPAALILRARACRPAARPARRLEQLYFENSVTWVWFMLEPWEVALLFSCFAVLAALVASACFAESSNYCGWAIASLRQHTSWIGGKLLSSTA